MGVRGEEYHRIINQAARQQYRVVYDLIKVESRANLWQKIVNQVCD